MIVKNEERFLAQCLRSVADVVDEIIICDTGSTDATIEIAKSFGATVIERPWRNDFAWARNQSIEPARYRWIMFLDADEELTPESKPAVRMLKNAQAYREAIWVRCFNKSDDYRGTGTMSHALIRVFPNNPEIRFRGLIHEFPSINNSPDGLHGRMAPITIVHHGYLKDVVKERNKGERNLEIVRAATEREPEDPFHWFNLGSTAFLTNDYELARDALETMRKINALRQRGFIPNGYALLAEVYGDKLNDPVKAEEISREGLSIAPNYANAHFQLGKALVAQKRYEEAREAYRAAIADGEFAHLQFVLDDQVYVWKAHSEIGASFVAQGDEKSASEWFQKGLDNAPNVEPLMVNLARSLDRQKRFEEAEAVFKRAFETHGDDMTSIDYVNFLLRRGRGLEAIAVIERAHANLSEETAVALLTAAAQIAEKHGMPAIPYYERAAERVPGRAEVLNPLETHYRMSGQADKLEQLLARERETEPVQLADFVRRSYFAIRNKDWSRALELAESGLRLQDEPHLRYNAAVAAHQLGDRKAALNHLQFIAPEAADVYPNKELFVATIAREAGQIDEAMVAVAQLLAHVPQHAQALAMKGELHEARGDIQAAEEAFRLAAAADRQAGSVALASFYLRQQRFEDAANVADSALR